MGCPTVIGIDVGGSRKGFHAVALSAGTYAGQLATTEVQELAHWCRSVIGAASASSTPPASAALPRPVARRP